MDRYENSLSIFSCNKYLTNRCTFLFPKELIWTNLWFVDIWSVSLNYHNTNNPYLYYEVYNIWWNSKYDWFVALRHTTCFLRNSLHNRVIKSINNLINYWLLSHHIFRWLYEILFFFLFRSYIPRHFFYMSYRYAFMNKMMKYETAGLFLYVNF